MRFYSNVGLGLLLAVACCFFPATPAQARPKPHDVTVSIKNNSKADIDSVLIQRGTQQWFAGPVTAGHTISKTLSLADNDTVVVTGSINEIQVANYQETLTGGQSQVNAILNLNGRYLPEADEEKALLSLFGNMGPSYGLQPLSLEDALTSQFGALEIVDPPSTTTPTEYYTLTPTQLGNELSQDKVHFSGPDSKASFTLKSSTLANLAVSVPLIGSMGLDLNTSDAWSVSSDLLNFTPYKKPEAADFDPVTAVSKLSVNVQKEFCGTLRDHPSAIVLYVNRMWGFNAASFTHTRAHQIASKGTLNAASGIITAGGAYNLDSDTTQVTNLPAEAVNFDGTPLDGKTMCALLFPNDPNFQVTAPATVSVSRIKAAFDSAGNISGSRAAAKVLSASKAPSTAKLQASALRADKSILLRHAFLYLPAADRLQYVRAHLFEGGYVRLRPSEEIKPKPNP